MKVRAALDRDSARIAALFVQLEYASSADALALRLPHLLRHPDTEVLVAAQDDAPDTPAVVQGVLVMHLIHPLHVARPWAIISALVVEQGLRSLGVGAALVAAAEQAALRRACAHVELSCSERRVRAHQFYESVGYAEVRKRFLKKLPEQQ